MKKLLIMMIAVGGIGYYMRTSSSDGHVTGAGFASLPAQIITQVSGIAGPLLALVMPQGPGAAPQSAATAQMASAPAMPNVTSLGGTYNAAANSGSTNGGAAGSGGLVIPPELTRFVGPQLLNSNPTGTQNLSPASQAALQQIIAQARANPSAFKDQLTAVARQVGGTR